MVRVNCQNVDGGGSWVGDSSNMVMGVVPGFSTSGLFEPLKVIS